MLSIAKHFFMSVEARNKKERSETTHGCWFVFVINLFLTFIVLVLLLGAGILYISKSLFEAKGPSENTRIFFVKSGIGIQEIARNLREKNFITSERLFLYGVNLYQKSRYLKAGEYEIPMRSSMQQILEILITGKSIEYYFTVPEGLTVKQVFTRIAKNQDLVGEIPKEFPPEGSLLTDTIKFIRGTSRKEIVQRLRDGQTRLVEEVWAKKADDLSIRTREELLVLASIVEKETRHASERPLVAAVFHNRLKRNMRLQSDPTVIYGIFGGDGKPANRPIYHADILQETPFNTYKINGLPPAPISNPGRASLEAVARPPKTEDLFFVANGVGGHAFSKTLKEHNIHVQQWRAIERNRTAPSQ